MMRVCLALLVAFLVLKGSDADLVFIRNLLSKKCVDGSPGTSETELSIQDCKLSNPHFQLWNFSGGFFRNVQAAGRCIDVRGAPGTGNGDVLQLFACEDSASGTDQQWEMTEGFLHNKLTPSRCMDVVDPGHERKLRGVPLPLSRTPPNLGLSDCQTSSPTDSIDHRWELVPFETTTTTTVTADLVFIRNLLSTDSDYFQLKNGLSGLCLDVREIDRIYLHLFECSNEPEKEGVKSHQWWKWRGDVIWKDESGIRRDFRRLENFASGECLEARDQPHRLLRMSPCGSENQLTNQHWHWHDSELMWGPYLGCLDIVGAASRNPLDAARVWDCDHDAVQNGWETDQKWYRWPTATVTDPPCSKHQFYDVGKGECDSCPEGMVGDVENTRECIKPSIFGMESTTTAGIELIVGVVGGVAGLCGCLGTAIACLYKRATGKNIN